MSLCVGCPYQYEQGLRLLKEWKPYIVIYSTKLLKLREPLYYLNN